MLCIGGLFSPHRLKPVRDDKIFEKDGTAHLKARPFKDSNMAVTKAKKIEQVEELAKELQSANHAIVGTFAKMTVEKDFELRKVVRGAGARYRVVKNTLAERAAKGTSVEQAMKDLAGVTSIAYTSGDPVALAKALSRYAKDNPEYTFKAGMVEGRVIAIKDIDALANMPSKEEIYSKLLFLMSAPAQRLVTAMNAIGRNLAVVVNQGVQQNKFAGAAEPTTPAAAEAAPADASA
ncbi:MAG TPA: 50S ribosomal protein L10 [Terriglobia bacterium]|nr:50S ribosomal protein L10 [Terriglobia bacterium]